MKKFNDDRDVITSEKKRIVETCEVKISVGQHYKLTLTWVDLFTIHPGYTQLLSSEGAVPRSRESSGQLERGDVHCSGFTTAAEGQKLGKHLGLVCCVFIIFNQGGYVMFLQIGNISLNVLLERAFEYD